MIAGFLFLAAVTLPWRLRLISVVIAVVTYLVARLLGVALARVFQRLAQRYNLVVSGRVLRWGRTWDSPTAVVSRWVRVDVVAARLRISQSRHTPDRIRVGI